MRRLRLSRTGNGEAEPLLIDGQPAVSAAPSILEYVASHGPPALGGFLAEPVPTEDGRSTDWYAAIPGTAIPLASLQGGDRIAAEERLRVRIGQLSALAETASDARLKALLSAAASYLGADSVYVVGQAPVLTQWGCKPAAGKASVVPPVPASVPVGAAGRRLWPWLGAALLLTALALLGLFEFDRLKAWLGRGEQVAVVAPPSPPADTLDPSLVAQLQSEQSRADALRQEVEALRQQFEDEKKSCTAPPPVQPPPSAITPPPQPPVQPAQKQTSIPVPVPKPVKIEQKPVVPAPPPKISVPPVQAAVPVAPEVQQKQSCAAAVRARKPWDAPELVFVIDASGSMAESTGNGSRLDAAKDSVAVIADNLPADVDTALVKFTNCNAIDNDYFLSRSVLKQKVDELSPQGGTPLARSIERAANILSQKKDTVMVVVTDGEDSCHQKDPCQVAAAAKASHPRLTINVVDVSGEGLGSCIARAGGGKVLPARTAAEIKSAMQQAAYENTLPAACKGAQ